MPLQSKATPLGAVAKLAAGGTLRPKKDLGHMMMETYGQDVYVASVCLEANMQQVINAMVEAAAYPGPSLVLGYAPCILQVGKGARLCMAMRRVTRYFAIM